MARNCLRKKKGNNGQKFIESRCDCLSENIKVKQKDYILMYIYKYVHVKYCESGFLSWT